MTPKQLLNKITWQNVRINVEGDIIPSIQCKDLKTQQVRLVGQALQQLKVEMADVESLNGVFPVGSPNAPTGLIVGGKDNLRKLADAGVNFPGASEYISPELN